MQIVLQATQGIVSGSPHFFRRAFGDTFEEFEDILIRPQHFIFNREWYEKLGGRAEFDEYISVLRRLSTPQREELIALLSSHDPRQFRMLSKLTQDPQLRSILHFYAPIPKTRESVIWRKVAAVREAAARDRPLMADDERVEDAGLFDDAPSLAEAIAG
jgi:hypothetical protein